MRHGDAADAVAARRRRKLSRPNPCLVCVHAVRCVRVCTHAGKMRKTGRVGEQHE